MPQFDYFREVFDLLFGIFELLLYLYIVLIYICLPGAQPLPFRLMVCLFILENVFNILNRLLKSFFGPLPLPLR